MLSAQYENHSYTSIYYNWIIQMRHQRNRTIQFETWQFQKKDNVLRTLLTNLVAGGQIVTTSKRAFVLKAYADSFFARVVRVSKGNGWRREAIRIIKSIIWTETEGKKVLDVLIPSYIDSKKDSGFIASYKLWMRKWDRAEEVLVKLI